MADETENQKDSEVVELKRLVEGKLRSLPVEERAHCLRMLRSKPLLSKLFHATVLGGVLMKVEPIGEDTLSLTIRIGLTDGTPIDKAVENYSEHIFCPSIVLI